MSPQSWIWFKKIKWKQMSAHFNPFIDVNKLYLSLLIVWRNKSLWRKFVLDKGKEQWRTMSKIQLHQVAIENLTNGKFNARIKNHNTKRQEEQERNVQVYIIACHLRMKLSRYKMRKKMPLKKVKVMSKSEHVPPEGINFQYQI